ncbi:hypothetical protein [Brucella intermedia]|uniref:hypothetical protein n=1 Tax=Brucella intermedia TaxID=94625 RepID=UPI002360D255|nr:hypothetical protein [Brucella intermedia]
MENLLVILEQLPLRIARLNPVRSGIDKRTMLHADHRVRNDAPRAEADRFAYLSRSSGEENISRLNTVDADAFHSPLPKPACIYC